MCQIPCERVVRIMEQDIINFFRTSTALWNTTAVVCVTGSLWNNYQYMSVRASGIGLLRTQQI